MGIDLVWSFRQIRLIMCPTAVHLNVDPNANATQKFRRKLLWVFIGLFCPEIVLASSFEQWQKSHDLHQRVKFREPDAPLGLEQETLPLRQRIVCFPLEQIRKPRTDRKRTVQVPR